MQGKSRIWIAAVRNSCEHERIWRGNCWALPLLELTPIARRWAELSNYMHPAWKLLKPNCCKVTRTASSLNSSPAVGPFEPLFLLFLSWVLNSKHLGQGTKRLPRTVVRILMVADPLVGKRRVCNVCELMWQMTIGGRSFVYRDIDRDKSTVTEITRRIRRHRGRLPHKKFYIKCGGCTVINPRAE